MSRLASSRWIPRPFEAYGLDWNCNECNQASRRLVFYEADYPEIYLISRVRDKVRILWITGYGAAYAAASLVMYRESSVWGYESAPIYSYSSFDESKYENPITRD
jgi:hypothetical protein